MTACTTDQVCGDLDTVDWGKLKTNFPHLKNILLPRRVQKGKVDLLIGLDHPELHASLSELTGLPGQPIARLTPLGWSCVGKIKPEKTLSFEKTFHANTFFCKKDRDYAVIHNSLQKMWEYEKFENSNANDYSIKDKELLQSIE